MYGPLLLQHPGDTRKRFKYRGCWVCPVVSTPMSHPAGDGDYYAYWAIVTPTDRKIYASSIRRCREVIRGITEAST